MPAIRKRKAKVVEALAILSPLKPYCRVINDAMVDAGIGDDLTYIISLPRMFVLISIVTFNMWS